MVFSFVGFVVMSISVSLATKIKRRIFNVNELDSCILLLD